MESTSFCFWVDLGIRLVARCIHLDLILFGLSRVKTGMSLSRLVSEKDLMIIIPG
jgi:hypothetical protein